MPLHEREGSTHRKKLGQFSPDQAKARLALYQRLSGILDEEFNSSDATEITPTDGDTNTPSHEIKMLDSTQGDSAIGISFHDKSLNGTSSPCEQSPLLEHPDSKGWSFAPDGCVDSESSPSNSDRSDSGEEMELAEKFHAALGGEIDVVRQQILQIISEGKTLFPLELVSQLYCRFGRRLPATDDVFSPRDLLAWLRCISNLNLENLVFMNPNMLGFN